MMQLEQNQPGVDFSNVFRSAKFIEIALSIFAVRRCPTLWHKFEAKKFNDTAKGRKLLTRNRPQVFFNFNAMELFSE